MAAIQMVPVNSSPAPFSQWRTNGKADDKGYALLRLPAYHSSKEMDKIKRINGSGRLITKSVSRDSRL
jgi:hypothetical protein